MYTPEKLQTLIEDNRNNIKYYHDVYDYFEFENDDIKIVMKYNDTYDVLSLLTIYKKEISKVKSIFGKEKKYASKKEMLCWGERREDKIYSEFWSYMSKLLLDIKKQKISEELINAIAEDKNENEIIEKKKKGYTSRMIKAATLMEGEK